jgi:leucyl aminopeptidase
MLIHCESLPGAVPLWFATKESWPGIKAGLPEQAQAFASACRFEPAPGRHQILPNLDGRIAGVVFGLEAEDARTRDLFLPGQLAAVLPAGVYRFANSPYDPHLPRLLGSCPATGSGATSPTAATVLSSAFPMVSMPPGLRELRPASRWGVISSIHPPTTWTQRRSKRQFWVSPGAMERKLGSFRGDRFIEANLPLIHAVGRASAAPPRLAEFSFGEEAHPKVTVVGKGVCFDSGGLDIKPESAMKLMKKDMGGAAAALALAFMVMDAGLPVRLRVIVPIVENATPATFIKAGTV